MYSVFLNIRKALQLLSDYNVSLSPPPPPPNNLKSVIQTELCGIFMAVYSYPGIPPATEETELQLHGIWIHFADTVVN